MKHFYPFLITIIVFSLFFFFLIKPVKQSAAIIDGHTFLIEIAKTPKQQEIGLAKYASLGQNRAMYFPFQQPGLYAFWMKNMKFPIDIIFLRNKQIITMYHNVPAPIDNSKLPIYQPKSPTDSVLEINAGLSEKFGFHVGDKVILSL